MQQQAAKSTLSHPASLAYGLNLFARLNADYRATLNNLIREFDLQQRPEMGITDFPDGIGLLIPPHPHAARVRTEWFVRELTYLPAPERHRLKAALATQLLPTAMPDLFWWGLRATEKYGPVAGDMISDGKAVTQIVVLHPKCSDWGKVKLARAIHDSSTGVISDCMESAGRDFGRLEPEVSEWLLSSRSIEVYRASDSIEVQDILERLSAVGMPHRRLTVDSEEEVLALRPAFAGSFEQVTSRLALAQDD